MWPELSLNISSLNPIEIMVPPEQTQYDLQDAQLMATVIYSVVVLAENSSGVGPPSNTVFYRRRNGISIYIQLVHAWNLK